MGSTNTRGVGASLKCSPERTYEYIKYYSKYTAKTTQDWLRDKSLNVLERLNQSPDLNLNLTIAVQRRSPSNLTELERICREEWEKLPKYRSAKLVVSYPSRL